MGLVWQLAFRYLRGRRTANVVPILSRISIAAITVSSAAMIILFSVTNGLSSFTKANYKAFYPDLRIGPARGKFFALDTPTLQRIAHLKGVRHMSRVIEDNAFAVFRDQQKVIFLKGVDEHYMQVNDIGRYIVRGDSSVYAQAGEDPSLPQHNRAILGREVINELGTDVNALMYFTVNYPNPAVTNPAANPTEAFQSLRLYPTGVFRILEEFDNRYILAALAQAQELFHQQGSYSYIEMSAEPGAVEDIQHQLQSMLGDHFKVQTRYEQNHTLYMVLRGEKWAVYAIMLLVLLIASFNMVGALSMLVLQKQKDIGILKAMGASREMITGIFLIEGLFWSFVGGALGILLGCTICLLQQKFGLIRMGPSFFIDSYPVEIQARDIVLTLITILVVGMIISWYPASRATRTVDPSLKST